VARGTNIEILWQHVGGSMGVYSPLTGRLSVSHPESGVHVLKGLTEAQKKKNIYWVHEDAMVRSQYTRHRNLVLI
jgi:hypothetical protein